MIEKTRCMFLMKISRELRQQLRILAAQRDITMSQYVRELIVKAVKENNCK